MRNTRHIRIRIDLNRRQFAAALACALVVSAIGILCAETLTMTTYYPSPVGIYRKLVSTAQAVFARDAGDAILVPPSNAAGKVGIGTTAPVAKLDIQGSIAIRDGTQGANKFLTSDADGGASWTEGGGWPGGSYCVMMNGGSCPAGFAASQLNLVVGMNAHDHCEGIHWSGTQPGSSECNLAWPSAWVNRVILRFCCK
ncbi:MAG TPA: hypothetical protein DD417_04385 [Elusimicrobia bacterium]|nr:hypothetical protein [Elusimicrobiota bacterium]